MSYNNEYNNTSLDQTNGNQFFDNKVKTSSIQMMDNELMIASNCDNNNSDDYEILEASKVLHLALQQMDGIIASCDSMMSPDISCVTPMSENTQHFSYNSYSFNNRQQKLKNLLSELNDLHISDNQMTNKTVADKDIRRLLTDVLIKYLKSWSPLNKTSQDFNILSKPNFQETDKIHEKLDYYETERQHLILQMGIMSEQIDSQSDKIAEMEEILENSKSQLMATEDMYQQSMLTKSSLEGTKLDLLSEVTKLRLELSQSEHLRVTVEDRARKLDNELSVIRSTLLERETEISALRLTLAKMARTTGYLLTDHELSLLRGKSYTNDFVRNRIQSPKESRVTDKPPLPISPRLYSNTSSHSEPTSRRDSTISGRQSPSVTAIYRVNSPPTQRSASPSPLTSMTRSTSAEDMKSKTLTTPNYSTLPHLHGAQVLHQIQQQLQQHEMTNSYDSARSPTTPNSMSSLHNRSLDRSNDNLRPTDMSDSSSRHSGVVSFAKEDQIISSARSSTSELPNSVHSLQFGIQLPNKESKPKGLKRIFSRPKRSPSSSSGLSDNPFTRGGFRSTSGPRLGYSPSVKKSINVNLPFSRWDTNLVADWFSIIGLGMYVNDCKRWCKNGEHLMRATAQEVEKELGIRNALHRKKLRLAVSSMNQELDELSKCADQLDYLWVARWLDDIGLPQYKDVFIDARIDGRVLHYLTVEDLLALKITSQLHHSSIRYGIKVLREQKFNSQCLKRRAGSDETNINEWIPEEITLWTSHRVMEWLRSIDLSEFAPNLRGSGVHGGLIVYELAFNADLFATLLSIPNSKTLLRRHISIKFKQLVGNDLCRAKRDHENQPNYVPLIVGAKVKVYKKGQFTLKKKRKADVEYDDYVCPISDNTSLASQTLSQRSSVRRQDSISSTNSGQQSTGAINGNSFDKVTDV
ncbi:liprin-beta-2-like isoform X3 [Oppia nitens]|uniref:liprin-beta-2-like isoform X3 n=1 Tax=Oppia nitens TaxID=1686743 RepID=UPI0023D9D929|nr:liprin-beta-2-like isoform X3 [Oppia nitens]